MTEPKLKHLKICFKCKKYISNEENYMRFTEFNKGKEVKTDYCHKMCWDEFLKRIGDTTEAMGMLRGLKTTLTKMGMLPPEEVVVT